MEFEVGNYYRHVYSMDVDIFIEQILAKSEATTEIRILWVSQSSGRVIADDTVVIKSEHYPNWKKVNK